MAATTKTPPTTIGSKGTSGPRFTFGGRRRPDFCFVPRGGGFVRVVEATALIEYRPTLSGLDRRHPQPI
jgi:hypothetical protein